MAKSAARRLYLRRDFARQNSELSPHTRPELSMNSDSQVFVVLNGTAIRFGTADTYFKLERLSVYEAVRRLKFNTAN